MQIALNHMTLPELSLEGLANLAGRLGCIGVELRNDLTRPVFDGGTPERAARIVRDAGLRILGLSQITAFNDWSKARADALKRLIDQAQRCGAETISLIPRNDGQRNAQPLRDEDMHRALDAIEPILRATDMTALIEPLGFEHASLRSKTDLVAMLTERRALDCLALVHDTFHHALAGGGPLFADTTGMVHMSGVDIDLPPAQMQDTHRGLIGPADRLGTLQQIIALEAAGFHGPVSLECFAPDVQALQDPFRALQDTFDFIQSQRRAHAA